MPASRVSASSPPAPVEARVQAIPRRDQILNETLRIVGERGYHGFGIQGLAERCGLTKPGLLHHFGTKEQLLIALLNDRDARHEAELSALFLAGYDAAASPQEQKEMLRRSFRAVVERNLEHPELVRLQAVLRAEAINPEHPAHAYFAARELASLERLTMRVAAFSPEPQSTARQILAMMTGFYEQWLREGESFDLLAEWDRALKALLS